jgi:glyoxylase-like metal-dependent hydrolase (beta-lactamase superfamily II)
VAAVRESFEESGILLAVDERGAPVDAARMAAAAAQRHALSRGELAFADLLAAHGLRVPADALAYFDHWVTPPKRPRRFDTRFFMAIAPTDQAGHHDEAETIHNAWLAPGEALARAARNEIEIAYATRCVLEHLARFRSPEDALDDARSRDRITCTRACIAQGRAGERIFRCTDPAYHEIHWSDPDETTTTTYDLVPGVPKRLDARVTRIIAPNPGMMTGPGTNTYLVGTDALAVIDPGPAIDAHIDAIADAGRRRIRWILCTHTHRDHSPAAARLAQLTGATIVGLPAPPGATQDATFAPTRLAHPGTRIEVPGATLRALHTPGHASNHVCWLLEETRMLFTGDHVMQGSTVIINPPDGDMQAYLRSLEGLLALDLAIIAPGHGYLIGEPHAEVRRLIAHRLRREAKVVAALRAAGEATVDALVRAVYDDVDARLHGAASRSLTAHLHKLVADGRAAQRGERYVLIDRD